jgi:hypothetical protein
VTLMRSVGILARPAPPARPNPAGPPAPLEGPVMAGPVVSRLALTTSCSDAWALADSLWTPLRVVRAQGVGSLPDTGSRLTVRGAQVSSLRRVDGALEVRLFNPGDEPTTVHVDGHQGTLVDLTGDPVAAWEGSFSLGPWEFATARLAALSLD